MAHDKDGRELVVGDRVTCVIHQVIRAQIQHTEASEEAKESQPEFDIQTLEPTTISGTVEAVLDEADPCDIDVKFDDQIHGITADGKFFTKLDGEEPAEPGEVPGAEAAH